MWPKNNSFHRSIAPGVTIIVLAICAVVIIACLFFAANKIVRNGVGEFTTDYAEFVEPVKSSPIGDTLVITVKLDTILIGDKSFSDIYEAEQVIADAVTSGKHLRVVDDYALAATYNDLIEAIIEMNVSRSDIEEIKQP